MICAEYVCDNPDAFNPSTWREACTVRNCEACPSPSFPVPEGQESEPVALSLGAEDDGRSQEIRLMAEVDDGGTVGGRPRSRRNQDEKARVHGFPRLGVILPRPQKVAPWPRRRHDRGFSKEPRNLPCGDAHQHGLFRKFHRHRHVPGGGEIPPLASDRRIKAGIGLGYFCFAGPPAR